MCVARMAGGAGLDHLTEQLPLARPVAFAAGGRQFARQFMKGPITLDELPGHGLHQGSAAGLGHFLLEEQAEHDLPRTTIKAPFDLRVSEAEPETGQYVGRGETLLRADGIGATEVEAEVPVSRFRAILKSDLQRDARAPTTLDEMLDRMGLSAEVRLRATGGDDAMTRWQARGRRRCGGRTPVRGCTPSGKTTTGEGDVRGGPALRTTARSRGCPATHGLARRPRVCR